MYTKCGEQYRRRYLNKERIPPGIAAAKGGAAHKAAEVNFVQKIETHADLPVTQAQEAAAAAFEDSVRSGISLTAEEESAGSGKVLGEAKDRAVALTGVFMVHAAPHHQPVLVEQTQRVILKDASHDLVVKLDLVNDIEEVVDHKFTGKTMAFDDLARSTQMKLYALAYHALTGKAASKLVVENIVDLKTPKHNPLEMAVTPDLYEVAVARVNAMLAGLKAGVFLPAPEGAWWCAEKWCGYFNTCPFANKNRADAPNPNGG